MLKICFDKDLQDATETIYNYYSYIVGVAIFNDNDFGYYVMSHPCARIARQLMVGLAESRFYRQNTVNKSSFCI